MLDFEFTLEWSKFQLCKVVLWKKKWDSPQARIFSVMGSLLENIIIDSPKDDTLHRNYHKTMEANHIKFSSFDFIKVKGDTIELNSPETQFFFFFSALLR